MEVEEEEFEVEAEEKSFSLRASGPRQETRPQPTAHIHARIKHTNALSEIVGVKIERTGNDIVSVD